MDKLLASLSISSHKINIDVLLMGMTNLSNASKYSVIFDRTIKKICEPLIDCLGVEVFSYSYIDADGRFCYLSNEPEFTQYYFEQHYYLHNPYCAHPALFRSGHAILPCTVDAEAQQILRTRFEADHFLLSTQANESSMESFVFANRGGLENNRWNQYIDQLDLLNKFGRYFKREAEDLIGKMTAEGFNAQIAIGKDKFLTPSLVPLCNNDPKVTSFLKTVTGLSRQEQRCLDLFKQGKSAQQTGAVMGLAKKTVEHYFDSIKNKLGCSSKWDLLNH
ncbi:MAG: helix-turn-helix transcriptional regulator [Chlamydiales bacterium]|nr:helix-turn-helix transcriptional regulator [Chlamydiales bacterium]